MSNAASTNESMRERAVGTIKILVKAFDNLTGAGEVDVPNEHADVFIAVYGWWAWLNRTSKLVLIAHDAGLGHEAAPNVRTILEHTLVMQWVADVGADALATLIALDSERRRKFIDELTAAGWPVPEGVTAPPRVTHPMKRKIENFQELCITYDARSLYVPYRMLSSNVHPTGSGAMDYVTEDNHLAAHPRRDDSEANLAIVAVSLIQAALTINSLLERDTLVAAISDARKRLGAEIDRPRLK
jgi:hypothetical protein